MWIGPRSSTQASRSPFAENRTRWLYLLFRRWTPTGPGSDGMTGAGAAANAGPATPTSTTASRKRERGAMAIALGASGSPPRPRSYQIGLAGDRIPWNHGGDLLSPFMGRAHHLA